jgi:hypothetical protein
MSARNRLESVSEQTDIAPNPVLVPDLVALIGLLAVLEGELMAGSVSEHLAKRVSGRFARAGLLGDRATPHELRQAINDLNHRLRYARGEYDEPPRPVPVPE